MTRSRRFASFWLACSLLAVNIWAQTAGRITGTVVDQTENVVVGAEITLVNEGTGQTTMTTSTGTGSFVFPNVTAGTYTIRVQAKGFTVLERSRQVLNAGESLALGNLQLAVGTLTEKVTVEAFGASVQTDSSDQTAVLTTNQLDGLMSRGRDIVSLMTVLPGVTQNARTQRATRSAATGARAHRTCRACAAIGTRSCWTASRGRTSMF
jgi:hypothetical protein